MLPELFIGKLIKKSEKVKKNDKELDKKLSTGLSWPFSASAVDWLQHSISPRPIAFFKEH